MAELSSASVFFSFFCDASKLKLYKKILMDTRRAKIDGSDSCMHFIRVQMRKLYISV